MVIQSSRGFLAILFFFLGTSEVEASSPTCESIFAGARGVYHENRRVIVKLDGLSVEGTIERGIPFLRPTVEPANRPIHRVLTLIPSDNIGRAILFGFPRGVYYDFGQPANPTLQYFARRHPKLASEHGIGQAEELLLVPDAIRLNALKRPRLVARAERAGLPVPKLQFEDLSIYRSQHYSEAYFFDRFEAGFVPLASRGRLEGHDRAQEHLLGALFTPVATLNMIEDYVTFIASVRRLPQVKAHRDLRRALKSEIDIVSMEWDRMTSLIGFKIGDIPKLTNEDSSSTPYSRFDRPYIAAGLKQTHDRLSRPMVTLRDLRAALDSNSRLSDAQKQDLRNEIESLRSRYLRPSLSLAEARSLMDPVLDEVLWAD